MKTGTISDHFLLLQRFKRISKYLVCFLIGLGAIVLIGWQLNIEWIKRPLPHLAAMNPITALLFVLSGSAFFFLLEETASKKIKLISYILVCIVFVSALLKLLDAFGITNTQIDLQLFQAKLKYEPTGKFSNGMATNTAICFLLISVAAPLLHYETSQKIVPVHYIALVIMLIALLSIIGCLYRVQAFYMALAYIPMAIHTALGFLLTALVILFSGSGKGMMKELTGSLSGSLTARFLIPAAIVVPICLGYLCILGQWSHSFSLEFGIAALILGIIVVFVLLIWFIAVSLNKKDILRIEAEIKLNGFVQQLKESEEKFQKAFQASAAGISITRVSDSAFLDVNDAFAKMTGYQKEEMIGHTSTELGIVVNFNKRDEVLKQVRELGSASEFEIEISEKSGIRRQVLASMVSIVLKGEKYAINIIFDITDRKQAEAQLESVNKELQSFSYSISHDLRSPLRAIDGYAKILEEDYGTSFNKEGKGYLDAIQYNAKKMSSLIDDLLAFSRLGRKTVHKTELNMNELINVVIADQDKITKHKAEIKVATLYPANGDPALIQQVFVNLLSNAIKYSSKKIKPLIEISSELNNGTVTYKIKDNGDGFDMTYVDKLFGVFQRLHSDEEFEGTGVGLAIVQRIIDKHGGKVWAEAALGKGATFSFNLPIDKNT